jgi:hypothetical protein
VADEQRPAGAQGEGREVEWLPPRAPDATEPPRWDPDRPDPLADRAPPPPAPVPPSPPGPPSQPWPQPYGKPPSNNAAVVSLIAGIGGLVMFVFPAGLGLVFLFNLPASIVAWVAGVRGRRAIERGETREHEGMATGGLVLGIVGTILGVVAIIGWAIALATSEELREEFRRQIEESQT